MARSQSVLVRGTIEEIAEYFGTKVPSIPRSRRHPEDFEDVLPMLRPRGQQRSPLLAEIAQLSDKIRQEQHCSKRTAREQACKLQRDRYGQPLFDRLQRDSVQKQLKDADRAILPGMSRVTTDQIVMAMFYGDFPLAASMYNAALHHVRRKIREFVEGLSAPLAHQNTD